MWVSVSEMKLRGLFFKLILNFGRDQCGKNNIICKLSLESRTIHIKDNKFYCNIKNTSTH